MKILLITSEEWNDYVYGNGVLTNWFTGFPAEFAQIYASPGKPNNRVCRRYFRITDGQMARSLVCRRAGSEIQMPTDAHQLEATKLNLQRRGIYGFFKKISLWCRTPVVILRDAIWLWGRYDTEAMLRFVRSFNPDIVYCPRMATPKTIRLERIVRTMTDAPFIAFTADDEASYRQYRLSPPYWVRRWYVHRMFEKHVPRFYRHYWTFSEEQAADYSRRYGVSASTLYKCGDFSADFVGKPVGKPIRLVYAGRLYCNRWKTLAEIGKALREVNRKGQRMVLEIYTQDTLAAEQRKALCHENSVHMKGSVNPAQLKEVYRNADIALHVESMDRRNRLATRVSFSTKIIDLMASTCAILAVCWNRHCGYQYLHDNDAALCVDGYSRLLPMLQRVADNPSLVTEYARKAYECGRKNHTREKIQKQIMDKFKEVIAYAKQ